MSEELQHDENPLDLTPTERERRLKVLEMKLRILQEASAVWAAEAILDEGGDSQQNAPAFVNTK